jgi:hypothetical protein
MILEYRYIFTSILAEDYWNQTDLGFIEKFARNYRPSFRENKPKTLVFYD